MQVRGPLAVLTQPWSCNASLAVVSVLIRDERGQLSAEGQHCQLSLHISRGFRELARLEEREPEKARDFVLLFLCMTEAD